MQNAGRVSAVRPADEQKDIRLLPPDLVDIILRQLKRELSDQLCSGAEAGMRAASSVSSGTRPDTIIRSPPAADEQA